ncbi:YpsA SLOG family protein [Azohydromonas australica]|uniref:YpsA SLOG family protein n=1 Tax=Azohydromonas australica TaxID=364039 RepID=UPI0007E8EA78|nr:putative molybdenum carrier protein [Azohydromonas australica]
MAEDGIIPARYQLTEVPDGGGYRQRTEANVRDSHATLILSIAPQLTGGSHETLLFAERLAKPWLHLHPGMDWRQALRAWTKANAISALNVAGPRASEAPDIRSFTVEVLDALARMTAIAGAESLRRRRGHRHGASRAGCIDGPAYFSSPSARSASCTRGRCATRAR